jgi:uncharacterized ion transporter superfamily protein YfcC
MILYALAIIGSMSLIAILSYSVAFVYTYIEHAHDNAESAIYSLRDVNRKFYELTEEVNNLKQQSKGKKKK